MELVLWSTKCCSAHVTTLFGSLVIHVEATVWEDPANATSSRRLGPRSHSRGTPLWTHDIVLNVLRSDPHCHIELRAMVWCAGHAFESACFNFRGQ
eukprot:s611_g23.t1